MPKSPLETACVFTAVGAGVLCWFGWPVVRALRASRSWKQVAGSVSVSEERFSPGDSESGGRHYYIAYRYTVAGTEYTSDRRSFGSLWVNPAQARTRFAKGRRITVYYDPSNPQDAVLNRKLEWPVYFGLTLGGLFFYGGVSALWRLAF